jgi:hypothetical protein
MDLDWGVQVLHGKLMKSSFKRIQSHIHIYLESAAIVELIHSFFLPMVLRHPILVQWPVYQVESITDAS